MRVTQPVGIVQMTNIAIIKYRTNNNQKFEIACYKNKAINWRNGVEKDLNDVLQVYEVFTNATKGDVASGKELLNCFQTNNKDQIIKIILQKGDLQVGDKEREAQLEHYYRDIVKFIQEKCIHAISGRQLTQQSIEYAISKVQFVVKTDKPVKLQALQCIKKLKESFFIQRAPMKVSISFIDEQMELVHMMLEELGLYDIDQQNNKFIFMIDPKLFRTLSNRVNEKQFKSTLEVIEAAIKQQIDGIDNIAQVELQQRLQQLQISDSEESDDEQYQKQKDKSLKKNKQQKKQQIQQQQHMKKQVEEDEQNQLKQIQQQQQRENAISDMIKQFKCTQCLISFDTNQQFRQHYKTNWHLYNSKFKQSGKICLSYKKFQDSQFQFKMFK
ncbi:unnamed protein product (macronuclear) [Paramecium tetraurelia]|uniref:C2H2-type domain-containing protein n=1 Tax=Paramecium tetraurelia TaxID=5888 RepID=A0DA82_PARTE|nr:uncharacterized protein GSPATT00014856001 [Paramecium tetraurelia]CAK79949.1 unnamed protein product [Paramecium tetraurelia]|eukprot:XP_001447346.1 hypothetical protein (macronuclear) [Paramecium tetraurelia strain d4-2]